MVIPQSRKDVEILTEPIDLNNVKSTTTFSPKLVFPSDIQFIDNKQLQVKVTVEVEQKEISLPEEPEGEEPAHE